MVKSHLGNKQLIAMVSLSLMVRTIGSASDTDAISISSGGVVAISATTANTDATDGALTVAGGASVAADFSVLITVSDDAILSFGVNSDVTLTHVHNTGIRLSDSDAVARNW